jgi:hypothetical protein
MIATSTAWRKAHPEQYNKAKERYLKTPKGKANKKRYYEKNAERISDYYKAWYKLNGRNRY